MKRNTAILAPIQPSGVGGSQNGVFGATHPGPGAPVERRLRLSVDLASEGAMISSLTGGVGVKRASFPASRTEGPHTDASRRKIKKMLVATKVPRPRTPPSQVSGVPQEECSPARAVISAKDCVPMSLVTAPEIGPRYDGTGNIVAHSILGDPADFVEMARKPASRPGPREVAKDGLGSQPELPVEKAVDVSSQELQAHTASASLADTFTGEQDGESDEEIRIRQAVFKMNTLDAKERARTFRKEFLSEMHIFERLRELRQERALKNWRRHSQRWHEVELFMAQRLNRDYHDLLMHRMEDYRQLVEERELIDEAARIADDKLFPLPEGISRNDAVETALNYGAKPHHPREQAWLGDESIGLVADLPKPGHREIQNMVFSTLERNFTPEEELLAVGAAEPEDMDGFGARNASRFPRHQRKWGEYLVHRRSQLLPFIEKLVAKRDDMHGLVIRGVSVHGNPKNESKVQGATDLNGFAESETNEFVTSILKSELGQWIRPDQVPAAAAAATLGAEESGPRLSLAVNHVSFEAEVGTVETSVITLYNTGTAAIRFEWVRVPQPSREALKVKHLIDGVQRFYFLHIRGVVQPGSAYDFRVIFKSSNPGFFSEKWKLITEPAIMSDLTVNLKGLAIEPDLFAAKKEAIDSDLKRKQATSAAKEIIEHIFRQLHTITSPDQEPEVTPQSLGFCQETCTNKRKTNMSETESALANENKDLKLYYTYETFSKLEHIHAVARDLVADAQSIPPKFDGSIDRLADLVAQIEDVDKRSELLRKLNGVVTNASFRDPRIKPNQLRSVCNDVLTQLFDAVPEISAAIRSSLELPLKRPQTDKFTIDETVMPSEEVVGDEVPATARAGTRAGAAPSAPVADSGRRNVAPAPSAATGRTSVGSAASATAGANSKAAKGGSTRTGKGKNSKTVEKSEPTVEEDATNAAASTIVAPAKDTPEEWSEERKAREQGYLREFTDVVRACVLDTIGRLNVLLPGAAEATQEAQRPESPVKGPSFVIEM